MLDLTKAAAVGQLELPFARDNGARFEIRLQESARALVSVVERGFDHWVLTFSGGKDSTATLVVALETALQWKLPIQRLDVVYSDTLVENPVIQRFVLQFLEFLAGFERLRDLPLHIHIVRPKLEDRFWTCLLGRGYPPPRHRFRWCTKRLKIKPMENKLRNIIAPDRAVIITGARLKESAERYKQLRTAGKCDQGVWSRYSSRLQVIYLAPIARWREFEVWDFLGSWAPSRGYPVGALERVYCERGIRFGCWVCTVVRRDGAMEKLVSQPKWAHLRPLLEFRDRVLRLTSSPESRYRRPDGTPGRLSLETRKKLLSELLQLQKALDILLIDEEEVNYIKALWKNWRYGEYKEVRG